MRTVETIIEYLQSLEDDKLIEVWNEFARENYNDDEIYFNDDDFFETFFEGRVIEAVRAVNYGEYNYTDKYVRFNGYANLVSGTNYEMINQVVDMNMLADDILENEDNYYDLNGIEDFDIEEE